jgi:ribose 5-phosphate isomerase B
MKIALASDHAGFPLKQYLVEWLTRQGHEVLDLGVASDQSPSDYPDAAAAVPPTSSMGSTRRSAMIPTARIRGSSTIG